MSHPYLSLLRTAWHYGRLRRGTFVLVYAMFGGANLLYAALPLLYGFLVNNLQLHPNQAPKLVLFYIAAYASARLLNWALHGPARILERNLSYHISAAYLAHLYHRILCRPVVWQNENHTGATVSRIRRSYEALRAFFDNGFLYLSTIFRLVFSMVAIVVFSPVFGFAAMLVGTFTIWLTFRFDERFLEAQKRLIDTEAHLAGFLSDSLSNIMTVITLRLERQMERALPARIRSLLEPFQRSARINEWKWFFADLAIIVIHCLAVVGYVWQHWRPGVPFYVGGLVALLGYTTQFTSVFKEVASQYTQVAQYYADVASTAAITSVYEGESLENLTSVSARTWNDIHIAGLTFSHSDAKHSGRKARALTDVNIRLAKGTRIAIVGESGSGKSTLLALLRGLYRPDSEPLVLFDGHLHSLKAVNECVTLVPQRAEIFDNTVAYNITLDIPVSPAELDEVCDIAHLTSFVRSLPNGMAHYIRENGANLSGGQKQRLALARGLIAAAQSDIILLDEVTSNVDMTMESAIYDRIFAKFREKAIVAATHSVHLLPRFDYIYVIKGGRVAGEGTFASLSENHNVSRQFGLLRYEVT